MSVFKCFISLLSRLRLSSNRTSKSVDSSGLNISLHNPFKCRSKYVFYAILIMHEEFCGIIAKSFDHFDFRFIFVVSVAKAVFYPHVSRYLLSLTHVNYT